MSLPPCSRCRLCGNTLRRTARCVVWRPQGCHTSPTMTLSHAQRLSPLFLSPPLLQPRLSCGSRRLSFFVSLARRLSTPCCCRKLCNVTQRRTARCTMPSRGGRRAVTRGPRSQPRTAAVAAELMPPSMPRRRCWRVAAGGRPRSLSVARHGRSRRCARAAVSAAPGHATQHAVRCGSGAVAGASAQCAPRHPDSGYPVPRGH